MKRISTCNMPEDENNLVQTRLGAEFWISGIIMHKAHYLPVPQLITDRG